MKKPLNILIFPAGMENGLEILKSLKGCKETKLFAASSNVMNQAFYVYNDVSIVRDVREDGWLDDLNTAIKKHNIDIVYPANSLVIDQLSPVRDQVDAPVLLCDHEIIKLTRSKKATIKALADAMPVPQVFDKAADVKSFPVFAKPDAGFGAQGAALIEDKKDLSKIDFDKFIVQEHLPGTEYTVDCFSDAKANLLFSGGRERSRIRMATSMHADIVSEEVETKLHHYAKEILKCIPITGAWFFQVKADENGILRLLEIDVRIAGTMCFNRARGINFPLLSIHQFLGIEVSVLPNKQPLSLDRCLKNRFIFTYDYDTVYVDLDDTLIIHDEINTELMSFLYQCLNKKKHLVLITKHLGNLKTYLKKWRISELFDETILLKEEESKAGHIKKERAIYIDDSFSQRREVHNICGVPTFEPSMVEALIDERL